MNFRSILERKVANELEQLDVEFEYEQQSGFRVPYLPDFTIYQTDASEELFLPRWVEVKPQEMIYDMFDLLGLSRYPGQYFKDPFHKTCYAEDLHGLGLEELQKPKKLAEESGENVLVVGVVRGTSRLSAEMFPGSVQFSRSHPFVNQTAIEKERLKKERQEEHLRRNEERRQEAIRRRKESEASMLRQRRAALSCSNIFARDYRSVASRVISPKFESKCTNCDSFGDDGELLRINDHWERFCQRCIDGSHGEEIKSINKLLNEVEAGR